jgi:LPPG:FO 2-phospho-L-lactate transferase
MTPRLVVALSGGVGGAKLAQGLSLVLPPDDLLVVANTGDDFDHMGLKISPDLDTLMYTLAGLANPETGWGLRGESWSFMHALAPLGGETWFRLGDRDLATHVERTRRLRAGATLSAITADFCRRLGVAPRLVPMTDVVVPTRVLIDEGWIDFQDYFVRRQCAPVVRNIAFIGASAARANAEFLAALQSDVLRGVVFCPSNPLISIEPILAIAGVRDALAACPAPVIAVSPIIGGRAVKGPTAKLMQEFGLRPSVSAVARRYAGLIDGFILDEADAAEASEIAAEVTIARTLMTSTAEREAMAHVTLDAMAAIRRHEMRRRGVA